MGDGGAEFRHGVSIVDPVGEGERGLGLVWQSTLRIR